MKELSIDQLLANCQAVLGELFGPSIYAQLVFLVVAVLLAFMVAALLKRVFHPVELFDGDSRRHVLRDFVQRVNDYIFPFMLIVSLGLAVDLSATHFNGSWLIRFLQSCSVAILLKTFLRQVIRSRALYHLALWMSIPLSILFFMGWLDFVSRYLDIHSIEVGNIKISANAFIRVVIFGSLLFWLGRASNTVAKKLIRNQEDLDVGTREVIAKLFEVALYVVIFILLLQVMGINITTLAVFGGALAVGLGFGLQSIASNFISGIIILLDRSLTVGDYIEMDDQSGVIRELNMRSTTLETFDGKDIMVPNEKFITSSFINWTHKNQKQRYSINLQVSYQTDLHALFPVLRETVSSHVQVISGDDVPIEERPDAEIASFGDSGVNILIEFWMEGVDDGPNRVGGDLLLMIWDVLREHSVEIAFPQREVRILAAVGSAGGNAGLE